MKNKEDFIVEESMQEDIQNPKSKKYKTGTTTITQTLFMYILGVLQGIAIMYLLTT